jgi:hypothetical protein
MGENGRKMFRPYRVLLSYPIHLRNPAGSWFKTREGAFSKEVNCSVFQNPVFEKSGLPRKNLPSKGFEQRDKKNNPKKDTSTHIKDYYRFFSILRSKFSILPTE